MRMELSLEVKAELSIIAKKYFSHSELDILFWQCGLEFWDRGFKTKQDRFRDLLKRLPEDRVGERIKRVYKAISKDDKDELKHIIERFTLHTIDGDGNLIPITEPTKEFVEKRTYIEEKLGDFGFNETLANYKDALKTYKTTYKGSISLLRSTFESLVDEIIESKEEPLKSNQKDKLAQLEQLGIIKEIDTQECPKCHHKKKDNEFNYSYDIYSLLSHYGSHAELITDEVANFLFTSTIAFIWFLINRYENMETK